MRLTLIRHTRLQAEGLCYGRYDPPLAESFHYEANVIMSSLPEFESASFYCSPAGRCKRLAEYLALNPIFDDRLLELDFGVWEGKPWNEIPRSESDPWLADFVNQCPPRGESYGALQSRIVDFLTEKQGSGVSHLAMITHSGVIRAALAWIRNIPLEQSLEQIPLGFGEIIRETLTE